MAEEGREAGGPPGVAPPGSAKALEEMLVALRRSSKDLAFYPPDHPLLLRSLERATSQVRDVVTGQSPLKLVVGRSAFTFQGRGVGVENRQLAAMAAELFVRRIQQVFFTQEVSTEELTAFLRVITSDPKQILQEGGPVKVLAARGVRRIQVNEFDFRRLSEMTKPPAETMPLPAEEMASPLIPPVAEDQKPPTPEDQPASLTPKKKEQTVEALVERLEAEAVSGGLAGYEWAASRLETAAARAVQENTLAHVLAVSQAFLRHRQAEDIKPALKERAAKAVEAIAAGHTVAYLVEHLGAETGESGDAVEAVLAGLGPRVIPPLLDRLALEAQSEGRERIVAVLTRYLVVAESELTRALQEANRDQAGQLAAILGNIGGEGSVALLTCFLRHPDSPVRREAVHAMMRIGGRVIHRPLLQALRDPDPVVLEAAIGVAGAAKVKHATPALLRFARRRVLAGKSFAVRKAAVAALGAIGDPGVVPVLRTLLYARSWFWRAAGDELRQAAALSLLAMGRAEAREVVEAGAESWRRDVRRACAAALQRATIPSMVNE